MRAPCGCVGEVVVGAYVRCPIHDADPNSAAALIRGLRAKWRRGLEGHVEACACLGCQQCRASVAIELSTKDGRSTQTHWMGCAGEVIFDALPIGLYRNWRAVALDNSTVARGVIQFESVGSEVTVSVMLNAAAGIAVSFVGRAVSSAQPEYQNQVTGWRSIRQAAKMMNFGGHEPRTASPTIANITTAILELYGVHESTTVAVCRGAIQVNLVCNPNGSHSKIENDVRLRMNRIVPAGISYRVVHVGAK